MVMYNVIKVIHGHLWVYIFLRRGFPIMYFIEDFNSALYGFIFSLIFIVLCHLLWYTTWVRGSEANRATFYLIERHRHPITRTNSTTTADLMAYVSSSPLDETSETQRRDAVTETTVESNESSSAVETTVPNLPTETEDLIRIRLKFLSDEIRQVEGSLSEDLGGFKRRTFSTEMQANKRIRLIFNGHVLQEDSKSLRGHGLFNDCVVHCLILGKRPSRPAEQDASAHYAQVPTEQQPPEWNLSKILCFVVVCVLSVTWYCRFQFAYLFTITSTTALVGLTAFFVFGTFYSDVLITIVS